VINLKSKVPTSFEVSLQQWFRDVAFQARCSKVVCVVIPESSDVTLQVLFGKFYPSIKNFVEEGLVYLKNVVDLTVEDLDNQISEVVNVQHLFDLTSYSTVEGS
jgi:hypothetical protein